MSVSADLGVVVAAMVVSVGRSVDGSGFDVDVIPDV